MFQGSGGSRSVPLKEGEVSDVKIEVTAEDGTVKNYLVHVKRLSPKDASLSGLKLSVGTLSPDFSADTLHYCSKLIACFWQHVMRSGPGPCCIKNSQAFVLSNYLRVPLISSLNITLEA